MRRVGSTGSFAISSSMIDVPVWDDGGWLGFPRLTEDLSADLCVVGLGGSGLTAIEEGIGLGLSVIGVDAAKAAGEAAGRNGGFLLAGMPLFYHKARDSFGGQRARDFYKRSIDELERVFASQGGRRTGSIRVAASEEEAADIDAELSALRADGFEIEPYEGPEGQGILIPSDGVCNPMRRVRDLACQVADSGADLFEDSKVISIEDNRVVTALGSVHSGMIVIAVDGRLELLLPRLSGRVRTASLQMLSTAPDPNVTFTRPVYTDFGHNYYQQLPDGSVALGGHRHHFEEISWTTEPGLIDEVQDSLNDFLGRIGVSAPVIHRWAGHAGFTEDYRPVFEEIRPGVIVIGAYSGHGNIVGAIYGREAVRQLHSGKGIQAPL